MSHEPVILGLDASSTMLGWCVLQGDRAIAHGETRLGGADIAVRCQSAQDALRLLLDSFGTVDVIAIEAPVARFAAAVIPQARVSGALMALAASRWLYVLEIAPAQAKRALTERGNADKGQMQTAAIGYGVAGEHAADALGVALAARPRVRVVTEERERS